MPELLNMEVDPRGGINTRKGWVNTGPKVTTGLWDPRNAYAHTTSTGTRIWIVVTNTDTSGTAGQLYGRSGAGASWVNFAAATCRAKPHLADFTSWGDDIYVVRGGGQ